MSMSAEDYEAEANELADKTVEKLINIRNMLDDQMD